MRVCKSNAVARKEEEHVTQEILLKGWIAYNIFIQLPFNPNTIGSFSMIL